uniref:Uncharacterized protein n=1 Tax=Alexandrium monilatum TaxID=311494 RepID=A0A7S4UWF3_9DINO
MHKRQLVDGCDHEESEFEDYLSIGIIDVEQSPCACGVQRHMQKRQPLDSTMAALRDRRAVPARRGLLGRRTRRRAPAQGGRPWGTAVANVKPEAARARLAPRRLRRTGRRFASCRRPREIWRPPALRCRGGFV